jgi:hypothetical protein
MNVDDQKISSKIAVQGVGEIIFNSSEFYQISERINQKRIIADKHFKEKRTMLNIFQWLSPDVMILKMTHVCRKFYILSWNLELLNKLCFYNFGTKAYNQIRFKCAKRVERSNSNLQTDDKPRWIIEESHSEESSDFYSSNDEEAAHMRHDGNSSAEEENKLKDYLRREAR